MLISSSLNWRSLVVGLQKKTAQKMENWQRLWLGLLRTVAIFNYVIERFHIRAAAYISCNSKGVNRLVFIACYVSMKIIFIFATIFFPHRKYQSFYNHRKTMYRSIQRTHIQQINNFGYTTTWHMHGISHSAKHITIFIMIIIIIIRNTLHI